MGFAKPGGTASKNALTSRITLPIAWVKEMGLSPEERDVKLIFENNEIRIKKLG
jgi:hypothetical protein